MSENLIDDFNAGREHRRYRPIDKGVAFIRNMEPKSDAWHVGHEYEREHPHSNNVDRVWAIEGRRIVVRLGHIYKNPSVAPCAVYGIGHNGPYLIGQA